MPQPLVGPFWRRTLTGAALAGAVVLVACSKQPVNTTPAGRSSTTSGNTIGANTSRAAVEAFMTAVKASDLQAMSTLWGNDRGLARTRLSREELDKRLIVMQCLLNHDSWRFADESPRLETGGRQGWRVSLTRRRATANTTMKTVRGPGERWFLEDVDVTPLQEFCR